MASPRGLPVITAVPPTLVSKPFPREGWVYEEKYDGWRVLAYKHRRMTRLVSRNGRDLTRHFPALVAAVRALGSPSRSTGPRCAGA